MDAMLVIDMQQGLLNDDPKYDLPGVVERINSVSTEVRRRSGQVIFIQHCGGRAVSGRQSPPRGGGCRRPYGE